MPRIRTVKPELARHEGLFELERETGLPIRFAWAMLPGSCDREGRFKWRPRDLKLDILPYDDCDFSRVLDAWLTRGYLVKYRVGREWYGCIPTFHKHQNINNRESASTLPATETADEVIDHSNQAHTNATGTRDSRVDDAPPTPLVQDQGEGKGREGKNTTASSTPTLQVVSRETEAEWFLDFKLAYPHRTGDQGWRKAQKAARARMSEGHTADEMIEGARRYAAFCDATGKTGSEYVKQAATFLGPDKSFMLPWDIPPSARPREREFVA